SPSFAESGNVMAQKARALKSLSVSRSLEAAASYHSDQGEVWNGIAELQAKACCHSPTSAMTDVFTTREDDLRRCAEIFRCFPGPRCRDRGTAFPIRGLRFRLSLPWPSSRRRGPRSRGRSHSLCLLSARYDNTGGH